MLSGEKTHPMAQEVSDQSSHLSGLVSIYYIDNLDPVDNACIR